MKTLGEYLRTLREEHQLPQRVVAYQLDIDVSVLSRIENNNKLPKKRMYKIIDAASSLFGVPKEKLVRIYKTDIVANILIDEKDVECILNEIPAKIEYLKEKEMIQTQIEF